MKTSRIAGLACLGLVLLALPAAAIPNIQPCPNGYVLYASGTISYTTIANENAPHPVSAATATLSGTGRCYSLWSSALAFANAGCQTTVQDIGGSYQYFCWKCNGAIGPLKAFDLDAVVAVERAVSAAGGGTVVNVHHVEEAIDADRTADFYEVDIARGDVVLRVRVDGTTGATVVPRVEE